MADKKISELPLITTVSGSIVFVPIVHDGITEKITIQNFSKYTSQYSAHTGSAGNVFTGPQTINNSVTITGNQSVNGNVTISGRLTVHEVVAQYETASILFSTGSTKLGDQITDRHEFTGSTNITGSFLVNGANLSDFSASNSTLFTTYSSSVSESISSYSASNSTVFTNFSSSNAVISQIYSASNSTTFTNYSSSNSTTFTTYSSSNAVISQNISASNSTTFTTYSSSVSQSISSYSASNSTTFTNYSSSNSTTFTTYSSSVSESISSYSASNSTTFTNFSSSNAVISQTYSASNSTTFTNYSSSTATSINNFSTGVGSELSRVYQTTASLNTQTGSQGNLNAQIGIATGSLNTQTGSQGNLNAQIGIATGSLNSFTGSQIGKDGTLAIVTSSLRAEIGGIEAYTASLKSAIIVNGTNVRIIGELTASRIYTEFITSSVLFVTGSNIIGDQSTDKHEFTGSVHINDTLFIKGIAQGTGELNAFTGSQIGKDFTLSVVTSSLNAQTGSQQNLNAQIGIATGSLNSTTASLIGITNELMALTASMKGQAIVSSSTQIQNYDVFALNSNLYNGTGSLIAITNDIMALTASIKNSTIVSSSTQVQNYDVFALNSNLYNGTGSIKGEIASIEAYTASLKAVAIVSSSQQIQNYFTFAQTSSANTFYGNQSISGTAIINGGNSVRLYESTNTNYWDTYTYTDNTLRVNYKGAGNDEIILYNDGNLSLEAAITASNFKIKTAGGGIDFSITSNGSGTTSSELLNDYEEGTWSPQIYYQNATDQTNSTNVTQVGTYTKIGNVVVVSGVLQWTVTGSPANDNIGIKNLPFTSKAGSDYRWYGNVVMVNAGAYPTYGYILEVAQNSTLMLFEDTSVGAGNYGDNIGATGTKTARFTITYLSA